LLEDHLAAVDRADLLLRWRGRPVPEQETAFPHRDASKDINIVDSQPAAVAGTVAAIRRYPLKSMLGEALHTVAVAERGVDGDRVCALIDDGTGKVVSVKRPKRWGRIFELAASTHACDVHRPLIKQGRAIMTVAQRVRDALNAHGVDALADCFAEDYRSEQPAHPDRGFGGRDQVRANWSMIFAGAPSFTAELRRASVQDDVEWSEWRWTGDHADGQRLEMAGVIVMVVRDDRIASGSLYMEPIEAGGAAIGGAVQAMAGES
jgi:ketosteroid isomerase-like protein